LTGLKRTAFIPKRDELSWLRQMGWRSPLRQIMVMGSSWGHHGVIMGSVPQKRRFYNVTTTTMTVAYGAFFARLDVSLWLARPR
jgi:hypothetical protein